MDTQTKYFFKQSNELPPNLKGFEKGFTNLSVVTQLFFPNYFNSKVKRLPDIAQQMLNYVNSCSQFTESTKQMLNKLIESIPDNNIPDMRQGKKYEDDEFWSQYEQEIGKKNWLEVDWIFTEAYFYRAVNIITGNLVPLDTSPPQDNSNDPFKNQKEGALLNIPELTVKTLLERQDKFINEDNELNLNNLAILILGCLSGNQVDLSMWPGMQIQEKNNQNCLAINHLPKVLDYMESFKQDKEIKIVYFFDNAGLELFSDLCLIDYLLSTLPKLKIIAYLKPTPAFVSDATPFDFDFTLEYLQKINEQFAKRINSYISMKQFQLKTNHFSVCALPLWEAPELLQTEITSSDLTIFKGDLNYRKILGDKHWDLSEDFQKITQYVNARILALRTCKSMVGVGVDKKFIQKMEKEEPEWLASGKYEFIQSNL